MARPRISHGALWRWGGANLLAAVLYVVLGAMVGGYFSAYGLFPAPIWLPAGLAAVAAMAGGARILPGLFTGSFVVNYFCFASSAQLALLISLSNAAGPYVGALVARRYRPAAGLFTSIRGVLGFMLGMVALHPLITGTAGALALALQHASSGNAVISTAARWWLCDAGGTLYFAPTLLLWLGVERMPQQPPSARPRLDGVVWLGTAVLAALLFFVPILGALVRPDAAFLLAIPLSWVTLRISLKSAYTLVTLICVIATIGTLAGLGPFQGHGVANPLQSVGLLIVCFAMNVLTLMALVCERRDAEMALLRSNSALERRVADRTAELRRQAETDWLTGLANRRAFFDRASALLRHAADTGSPFALILFDLDHFKLVNDSGGHALGDAALERTAQVCAEVLRPQDVVGRVGGEEFAVALPRAGAAEALAVAERLRAAIAGLRISRDSRDERRITASFGVAWNGAGDDGLDALARRADAALYRAKQQGRDRVCGQEDAA